MLHVKQEQFSFAAPTFCNFDLKNNLGLKEKFISYLSLF